MQLSATRQLLASPWSPALLYLLKAAPHTVLCRLRNPSNSDVLDSVNLRSRLDSSGYLKLFFFYQSIGFSVPLIKFRKRLPHHEQPGTVVRPHLRMTRPHAILMLYNGW